MKTKILAAAVALVASAGIGTSAFASVNEHFSVKLIATNGYFIDNGAPGQTGGDLFGSEGPLRRDGKRIGRFSSACTATSATAGQCDATLILRSRGRIQLAGIVRNQDEDNRLSITGGSWNGRVARGSADLHKLNQEGSRQQVALHIR